jgi:hypothetical protein
VVRDHLSEELIEAGRQLLLATDGLNLQAQGAMWIYSHELGDWRYYLVTSLVDTVGRRETYKYLIRIFDAAEPKGLFPKELTVQDIHLGSPADEYFQRISSGVSVVQGPVQVKDCIINGIKFDGVIYRAVTHVPSSGEARKIEKQFSRKMKGILDQS